MSYTQRRIIHRLLSTKACHPNAAAITAAKAFEDCPGPKGLPVIGNIWRYLPLIGEMDLTRMHRNARTLFDRYGPLVREHVVADRVVCHIFHPRDMEEVFRHEGRLPARLSHRALLKYRRERNDLYKSGGLFPSYGFNTIDNECYLRTSQIAIFQIVTIFYQANHLLDKESFRFEILQFERFCLSNGTEWLELRQRFQKPLMQQGSMNVYTPHLLSVANDVLKMIRNQPVVSTSSYSVEDFVEILYKWALECTGILALDRRLGCLDARLTAENEGLIAAAAETHRIVMITENGLPFWKLWNTPSYNKLVQSQNFIADVVSRHLKKIDNNQLMTPSHETTVLQKFLTDKNIDQRDVFAMILDMFMAGIDTTAYTAAFALYYLASNPLCQEKLRKSLQGITEKDDDPTLTEIVESPYLRACIKESSRLMPIAIGVGRVLENDVVLSGYRVPAGTIMITHNQVACRLSDNFSEPDRFIPERWIKDDGLESKHHRFCYLPFGYGPRSCIGRRFADSVISTLLFKMITTFRFEYPSEFPEMDCITRLINVPDQPLKLKFYEIIS